jgi:hypothetical protein
VLIKTDILLGIFGALNKKILILQKQKKSTLPGRAHSIVPCGPMAIGHVTAWD